MGRAPRFPCSASAEVTSDNSVELTRVTELSRYGCYLVETARHRTPGTRVTVKIMNKDQIFEATATVLYSRPTMGMGVVFREVQSVSVDSGGLAAPIFKTAESKTINR
jgi:PilZ domain